MHHWQAIGGNPITTLARRGRKHDCALGFVNDDRASQDVDDDEAR